MCFTVTHPSWRAFSSSGDLFPGARLGLKAMGCPKSGMPATWPPGCHEESSRCVCVCVCINPPSLAG